MNKIEHIRYWIEQAEDDWDAVRALYDNRKYAHLVIEKLCKACWIRDHESNIPPRTHNLLYLLSQTKVEVPVEKSELMLNLNRFQLEGRYPDYINKMHQICNKNFTQTLLTEINDLKIWLLGKLQ